MRILEVVVMTLKYSLPLNERNKYPEKAWISCQPSNAKAMAKQECHSMNILWFSSLAIKVISAVVCSVMSDSL